MGIKKLLRLVFISAIFILVDYTLVKAQGDPYVDAGVDTSVTCSNPCIDLIGSYFYAGQTTTYLPIPIPYTPFPYNTGAPILVNIDDAWSNAINLPFSFCFFGVNYNKVVIGSNGLISFDLSYAGGGPGTCPWSLVGVSPLPNASLPLNSIMGVYEDIDPTNLGDIYWQVTGTYPSRKLVVSFYQIPYYGDPNSVSTGSCSSPLFLTSQIVLYETTNAIDIYIKSKPTCTGWNNGLAIEGIQNATGTVAYTIAGRNNTVWTATNDAYRFLPMGPNIVTFSWLQNGNVISNSSLFNVCPTQNTQYVAQVVYNGCNGAIVTLHDTVNVTVAVPFQSTIQSVQPSGCTPQNNGSASTSIVSGTGPFTYLWNTGATTSSINNLGPGIYTCTITDPSGCSKQDTVLLQYPSFLNANPAIIQNVGCASGMNGSITINATGGVAPYSYNWSNGATSVVNSSLLAGNYTVTITDQNGCTFLQTNTVAAPTALNVIPSLVNNNCFGGSAGSISLNVSGATPPYTYVWMPNVSSSNIGSGLINGNYTVTVTDNNGCTSIANATVTSPNALIFNSTITNSTCQLANASINVNPTGATPAYSYSWSNGVTSSNNQNILPAIYTLTITDNLGCVSDTAITITSTSIPALTITGSDSICNGNSVTLTANVNNGTSPYSYYWNPVSTNSSTATFTPNQSQNYQVIVVDVNGCSDTSDFDVVVVSLPVINGAVEDAKCYGSNDGSIALSIVGVNYVWSPGVSSSANALNLIQGNYQVTVTDNLGCTATNTFVVNQPDSLQLNLIIQGSTCNLPNGSVQAIVGGGVQSYNYLWSNSSTSDFISNVTPGSYSLTVTDANGCVKNNSVTINAVPIPDVSISGADSICNGNSVTLTANVNNGSSPYNYNWNPISTNSSTATFTPNQSQNYQVIVVDVNGCSDTSEFDVVVIQLPIINGAVDDVKCYGSNDGSIALTVVGGIAPFNYLWYPGISSISNALNLFQGNYQVTVTDELGCTATNNFVVNQPDSLQLNLIIQGSTCNLPNGSVKALVGGGIQAYSYLWNNASVDDNIASLIPGSYSLTVTDANGCTKEGNIVLNAVPLPDVSINAVDSICIGDNCDLNAIVLNQVAPITYQWSNGLPNLSTVNVSPSATQNYDLVVIDGNGCSDTTNFVVNVQDLPIITFNQTDTAACDELDYTFNALVVPSNVTYQWEFGDGNSSTEISPTNIYSIAGSYTPSLTVISTLGCESSLSMTDLITIHPNPQIDFNVTPSILFDDYSQAEFTNLSVEAVNYIWNFGDSSDTSHLENPIHFYPDSGTYVITLIGESDKGCIDSASNVLLHLINSYAFVPSSFTPNNDGKNDVLKFYTVNIFDFYFQILDRWGRILFETNNPEAEWDGTYQGTYLQEGVYVYKMEYKSLQRKHMETFGMVTLLR